ncbi:hypothetical protein C8J57DRAFT_1263023 [Mycena rebaudengoi]|nr:hypothetical protein C8J57DRAFT_1263023 [Mycena rebaudengoi]
MYLQIATITQALNIIAWLRIAQQEAYEMFSLIVQNCSVRPLEFLSEGEAYLLCNQQEIERNWWITVMGHPRPPRHVQHSTAEPRGGRQAYANNRYITGSAASSASDHDTPHPHRGQHGAPLALAPNAPMAAPIWERRHLTQPTAACRTSPGVCGMDEVTKLRSLTLCAAPLLRISGYFGLGFRVRNMLRQVPTMPHDTPLNDDVLAYHTIIAMSPMNRRELPHQFRRFFDTVMLMFSIPGLFDAIVLAGGYPAATLVLAHYPFLTDNIMMAQVASWFVQCGIAAGSPDILILESFARGITMFPVPAWAELEHPPSAAPGGTLHPRNPAGLGLANSQHAPMTGVEIGGATGAPPKSSGADLENAPPPDPQ